MSTSEIFNSRSISLSWKPTICILNLILAVNACQTFSDYRLKYRVSTVNAGTTVAPVTWGSSPWGMLTHIIPDFFFFLLAQKPVHCNANEIINAQNYCGWLLTMRETPSLAKILCHLNLLGIFKVAEHSFPVYRFSKHYLKTTYF